MNLTTKEKRLAIAVIYSKMSKLQYLIYKIEYADSKSVFTDVEEQLIKAAIREVEL